MTNRDRRSFRKSLQRLFGRKASRRAQCLAALRFEPFESRLLLHANNGPHPNDPTYDLNSFEISANLSIYADSRQVAIPAGAGDPASGNPDIHTHDDTGLIDIHPQDPRTDFVQLGDFFDAWDANPLPGSPSTIALSNTQLFDNFVDVNNRLQMFVNGIEVTDEFAEYQIHDNDNIVLVFGSSPVISFNTNAGSIPLELLADEAPNTVDNFLDYVNGGADGRGYEGTILHRSIPDLAVIGGAFRPVSLTTTELVQIRGRLQFQPVNNFSRHIPELSGIASERGPGDRSNSFGTLAGIGGRNGLTSGFFFNTADNAHLDAQGFTVFAVALGAATPAGQPVANATLNEVAGFTTVDVDRSNDNGGDTLFPDFDEVPYTPEGELVAIQSVSGDGTVRGRVFDDQNQDGVLNNGETGLPGRTVFSDANGNGLVDAGEASAVTDANGDYALYLEAGIHTVRQLTVPWENQTAPTSPDVFTLDVEIGRENNDIDFGNFAVSEPTATAVDDFFADFMEGSVDNLLDVLANDQFIGNANKTLRITAVGTTSQSGTVTIGGDGDNLLYTPAPNFNGTETFRYTVRDRSNASASTSQGTVTVTVDPVNSPPTANNDTFSVEQDSTDNGLNVLANDSDQPDDGETLTILSAGNTTAGGTVTVAADGLSVFYTPAAGRSGNENFTYTISDGNGGQATANVTVTVNAPDAPPSAVADTFTVRENTSNTTLDVLANDPVVPGATLTVAGLDTTATSGTVTIATDSMSVLYTPPANFRGTDTFTYTLSDGANEAAPVGVTVNVVDESAPGSLSGFVYLDANDNNALESFEDGIPGVVITLTGTTDLGATVEQSKLTDANGAYTFDGLEPGTYQLAKRQSAALADGRDSANGSSSTHSVMDNLMLAGGQQLTGINFGERGLQLGYVSIAWFFASTPSTAEMLRQTLAIAEEHAGDSDLAESIRNGSGDVPTDVNEAPVANNDSFETQQGSTLTVVAANGVLVNDTDPDNDSLTAAVVGQSGNGNLTLNADGSFTYEPNASFSGIDTFSYSASDGSLTSNVATVTVTVTEVDDPDPPNTPFGPVTPGSFEDAGVLGIRTDLQPGAPPLTAAHTTTAVDYTGYSNPPTYGPHHGFLRDGQGNSVTPRATGVYQTEQPDEDLLHNLEHGHVWISYNPTRLSSEDIGKLEQFVIDGGTDTGVILTPRAGNAGAIAAVSWARLQTFDSYDPAALRNFVETNRGKSPEGFIPAGQKAATPDSETVDDGLEHGMAPENPNTAPSANNDSFSTDRGSTLNISAGQGVLANDSDPENDNLTAAVASNPSDGTLTLNPNGSFVYTPNAGFTGVDTFTYQANDGVLLSNVATVSITVNATNNAPSAANDVYSIAGGQTLTVNAASGVLNNDSDPESDGLTAAVASNPTGGTLTLNADGSFTYQPNANFSGTDSFTYTANDGELSSNVASVSITVSSANSAPSAANDVYSVAGGQTLTVNAAAGVLNNDSDPDGDSLTAAVASDPTGGTLTLSADGSFTYQPNANFSGTDSFTYTVSDGSLSSSAATVEVTVRTEQTATTTLSASKDATLYERADGSVANGAGQHFFAGKTLEPANSLRRGLIAFDVATDIPAGATITEVTLELNMSRTIVDEFDVNLHRVTTDWNQGTSDQVGEEGGKFPEAPTAGDATWIHSEFGSGTWNTPGGDFEATPVATTPVNRRGTYQWSSPQMVANVQDWLDNPSQNFGWALLTNEVNVSAKRFDSRENPDAANQPRLVVTYTASASNTAPAASNDSFSTSEGSTLNVPTAQGVLANDSDPENDDLTATVVSNPTSGTLALNLDGSFAYTPNSGFTGGDTFTYRAHDGELFSNTASVLITVNSTNSAPSASNDTYSVDEGQTLTVSAATGVLDNDFDPDNDNLTAAVVSNPTSGTLTLNSDGSFTYAPNANFSGADAFTYQASDGSLTSNVATVSITVNSTNSAPSASNDNFSVDEGQTLTVSAATGVLDNDSDPENDRLTAAVVSNPTNGTLTLNSDGSFTYDPNANFTGAEAFTYQASDGSLTSNVATVSITVNSTNVAPSASNDSYATGEGQTLTVNAATGVLANDSDPDIDGLTAAVVSNPSRGTLTLNADGSFTYAPNANFTGADTFTYRANDGELSSNTATVTVTIGQAQTATLSASKDTTLYEHPTGGNTNGAGERFFAGRTAEPLNSLRRGLIAFDVAADIPAGATITDATLELFMSRTIVQPFDVTLYRATTDWNQGTTDQTGEEGGAHVTPPSVGDATWIHSEYPNAFWNTPGGDFDPTPIATTLVGTTGVYFQWNSPDLTASVQDWLDNPSQNFGWMLRGDETVISAKRFDSRENTNPATRPTLSVTYIVPSNTAPTAAADNYSVDEDQTLNVNAAAGVLANDSDPDNDSLTATVNDDVDNGQLTLNSDGSFTYTPNPVYNGSDSFTYTVSDGQSSSVGTVVITVNPVDEPQVSSVTIVSSRDTTLIESADGESGNGAGIGFFAGRNNGTGLPLRRGLVEFDLASAGIPAGATITNVELTLNMSQTTSGAADVALHRVTSDWGEGASSGGGSGAQAQTNDATWLHTFYAGATWNTPGGDFDSAASATRSVDAVGSYSWSSPQLVADVQSWLADPSNNYGWILIGDETVRSSKRFDSREHSNADNRPQLKIDYEV